MGSALNEKQMMLIRFDGNYGLSLDGFTARGCSNATVPSAGAVGVETRWKYPAAAAGQLEGIKIERHRSRRLQRVRRSAVHGACVGSSLAGLISILDNSDAVTGSRPPKYPKSILNKTESRFCFSKSTDWPLRSIERRSSSLRWSPSNLRRPSS